MKPLKTQKFQPIGDFGYHVVITMAKYHDSKEYTADYLFNDYEEAIAKYVDEISKRTAHLCVVDTSAVVGLYRGTELLKQIVLKSIC